MADTATPNVATPTAAYGALKAHWDLPQALRGGTLSMREAGTEYLPQFAKESDEAYDDRLSQSVLLNAFWRTVLVLASRPFQKPISVGEEAGDTLREWSQNVDLAGRDLTAFAHDLLADLLAYGICRFAVDFPTIKEGEGKRSVADEARLGLRPHFAQLSPLTVIGWQQVRGVWVRARVKDSIWMPTGDWGETEYHQVRVVHPDRYELYRKRADLPDNEWPTAPTEEWANTLGKVPIVTIGFNINDRPPLDDLAWLNLRHWQSQSDQDNILHVARVPLKHFAGFRKEEVSVLQVAAGSAIRSESPDAHVDAVEHSGEAIGAGRQHLQDLQEAMSTFGIDLLTPKKNTATATGRALDVRQGESDLQMMVRRLEAGLEQGLALMEEWGKQPASGASVDIYQDFNVLPDDVGHEQRFKRAVAGQLSTRTLIEEDKRAGLLSDSLDVDAELAELEENGEGL